MNSADVRRCEVLLSLQRALLGEVTSNLRAVTVTYTGNTLHFDAFFDGPIGDDERETMSLVETEVLADFPPEHRVTHQLIQLDAPALVPKDRIWAYHRKEPLR